MRTGAPINLADDFVALQDPTHALWKQRPSTTLQLHQTPAGMQPGLYVATAYAQRPYGQLRRAHLRCAWRTSGGVLFQLSWDCATPSRTVSDTDHFTDAAALMFADQSETPLITMGASGLPVTAWYWRAEREAPMRVSAEGLGTSQRHTDPDLHARAHWLNGQWRVVIGHSSQRLPERLGLAIWQGSSQDRGGLKSATLAWVELQARP